MKKFKEFVTEISALVPVVDIETTGTDINIPEIKNELERNIALTLRQSYKTVEEAVDKVRKILSYYSLDLPQVDVDDTKNGILELSIGHHHHTYDEFDGKLIDFTPFTLKFKYNLIDGLYKCSAELE